MPIADSKLNYANTCFREKKYHEALRLYDKMTILSPRNHWIRMNAVAACIKIGDLKSAKLRMDRIKCSKQLGDRISYEIVRSIERQSRTDVCSTPPINYPTDYYRWISGSGKINCIKSISINRRFPSGFPFELVPPDLSGEQNDYRFIDDVTNRYRAEQKRYSKKATIVVFLDKNLAINSLIERLENQTYPKNLFDLVIIKNYNHNYDLPEVKARFKYHKFDANKPMGKLNKVFHEICNDFIVFVPGTFRPDETFVERVSHYFHVTNNVIAGIVHRESKNKIDKALELFDCSENSVWFKERYPFRKIESTGLCISSGLFNKIGGFSSEIRSASISFKELAFRGYINGAYFLPIAGSFSQDRAEKKSKSSSIRTAQSEDCFEDYCSAHWYRKKDGLYKVPKVSIYIPSYNNENYIVQAIESVLDQSYKDIEICISDDGSTDGTLALLERKYSKNRRVRWESNANGGIGFASNRAVEMSRGMYVGQLDSDDVIKPGAIERLVSFLDSNPKVGCVYTSCERIDKNGNYLKNEYSFPEFSREKMMVTSIAHHFRMFRRQCWARTSGFREDIINAVDYDMFLKLSEVCGFNHIEEIFYQRRWHGNNTSFVNEDMQSKNTKRVLNLSIERLGLSDKWEAISQDPDQQRKISYRRKRKTTRIFFWPNYSRDNPYQKLLYSRLGDSFDVYAGEIDCAIKAIKDDPNGGKVVFHLHWLNKLFENNDKDSDINDHIERFEKKLIEFKKLGGKFVWTMHNSVSHESKYVEIELQFSRRLVDLSDILHLHSIQSLSEIKEHIQVQEHKIRIVPHGSYIGYYPNYLSRTQARRYMGIEEDDFVLLFCGQIRRYKGIEELVKAYCNSVTPHKGKLLIAGRTNYDLKSYLDSSVPNNLRPNLILLDRFIDDNSLQLFFNTADFSVFPYQRILTSGSVILSMSFGTPPIVPSVGMTRELVDDKKNGLLFSREVENGLENAIAEAEKLKFSGSLPAMQQAALAAVEGLHWSTVDSSLF